MMDILLRVLNAGLMIGMPVVVGVILVRRQRVSWGLYGAGAGTFILSQVLHLPFNRFLLLPGLEALGVGTAGGIGLQVLYSLALGFSAGIFEEVFRYLVLRFGARKARCWRDALMFGAGHGGVEAILVGGLALVTLFQVIAYNSPEAFNTIPVDQRELAASQIEAYWSIPWYASLLGALERALAMCFHISAAVLVMQVFIRRSGWWLALAVAWHALVDAAVVFVMLQWGVYASEGLLVVFALLSLWMVAALRRDRIEPDGEPSQAVIKEPGGPVSRIDAAGMLSDREVEGMDDTRFNQDQL